MSDKKITTPMILDAMPQDKVMTCTEFVRADSDKRGGVVGMGVPPEMFHDFAFGNGKWFPVLYLIDREAYFATKQKLEAQR